MQRKTNTKTNTGGGPVVRAPVCQCGNPLYNEGSVVVSCPGPPALTGVLQVDIPVLFVGGCWADVARRKSRLDGRLGPAERSRSIIRKALTPGSV